MALKGLIHAQLWSIQFNYEGLIKAGLNTKFKTINARTLFITTFKGTNLAQWSCDSSYECCACAFQVHFGARRADPHVSPDVPQYRIWKTRANTKNHTEPRSPSNLSLNLSYFVMPVVDCKGSSIDSFPVNIHFEVELYSRHCARVECCGYVNVDTRPTVFLK